MDIERELKKHQKFIDNINEYLNNLNISKAPENIMNLEDAIECSHRLVSVRPMLTHKHKSKNNKDKKYEDLYKKVPGFVKGNKLGHQFKKYIRKIVKKDSTQINFFIQIKDVIHLFKIKCKCMFHYVNNTKNVSSKKKDYICSNSICCGKASHIICKDMDNNVCCVPIIDYQLLKDGKIEDLLKTNNIITEKYKPIKGSQYKAFITELKDIIDNKKCTLNIQLDVLESIIKIIDVI